MADVAKRLEKAEKYLQKGKPESALEEYLSILDDDSENETAKQNAADLCLTLKRTKDAALLFGDLFDRQAEAGDQSKAIANYKKLSKISMPTTEQTFRYGQLAEKSSRREAIEAYETAFKAFIAAGQKKDALEAAKRITVIDPSFNNMKRTADLASQIKENKIATSFYLQMGDLQTSQMKPAFEWYERAYEHNRSNHKAALAYGRVLLGAGKPERSATVLKPFAAETDPVEYREIYARALLAIKKPAEAYPILWSIYEQNRKLEEVGEDIEMLIGTFLEADEQEKALEVTKNLEEEEKTDGRRREFVAFIQQVTAKHKPGIEFLEYLVELYNSANREVDYSAALLQLFDLYYAAGNYVKAGEVLDRAGEVDPYEAGHEKRLELLKGKIDPARFSAISNRFQAVEQSTPSADDTQTLKLESEPTVLEDFMLQAEIFLQYSMRSKAVERLQRINKLFPHEEEKNEKLRNLYLRAGVVPNYSRQAASVPLAGSATATAPVSRDQEGDVDNFARVTEITRNVYRQSNVKSVLFAAVNDVGRHWNASRCLAGLCTPGKPPSAALEYCAPGIKQSDVVSIVKLIGTLQVIAMRKGMVIIENAPAASELAPVQQHITSLDIKSILAVPLMDGDEHAGILVLQQCDRRRQFSSTDTIVLKTIADQMTLAVNNARLRTLMKTLAVTDEKSGLLKRSSYFDVLLSETRRALQQSSPTTLALLYFGKASALVKEIGEAAVESMMQNIGPVVTTHIRQNDVAIRYDLTMIAMVLSDTNDKNAFFVVDKLRKTLGGVKVPGTNRLLTMNAGIAELVIQQRFDPVDIVTEVINRAEAALEAARAQGANSAHSLAANLQAEAVA